MNQNYTRPTSFSADTKIKFHPKLYTSFGN